MNEQMRMAKEEVVTGPSTAALSELATSFLHMAEALRDARGAVEGPKA